ncbi:multicopper oxidase domain-containing protein [Virgibacillus oceani]|uniref:multicopper oxidase domain-containing protein n=1 Tax=Virgibacillus oceani TaxID=1479511 RepID=UPI003570B085
MRTGIQVISGLSIMVLLLSACSNQRDETESKVSSELENAIHTVHAESAGSKVIEPHQGVNQKPSPIVLEREGTDVTIKMTAQITDIEIEEGYMYRAWTFNGEAPGPLVVVEEGDTIHFTLQNKDPAIPHSMDFHAVQTAPDKSFTNVAPNETGTFTYQATKPGVFMYHCGTAPMLAHIANGMHGVIIVQPTGGYPTDNEVDREYVIVQNEWYKYNDLEDMTNGEPSQVVFSAKALHKGQINTNGTVTAIKDSPLLAKPGERVRIYINNAGPNEVSSFHVVGAIFDDVYLDGNPNNHLEGLQTVMLPVSGGAIVEFIVKEEGVYPFVTHQMNHAAKGAVGYIRVNADWDDGGKISQGH